MQLIDELESTPRGLYTGAIGWLDAPAVAAEVAATSSANTAVEPLGSRRRSSASSTASNVACGDFCLSVAIRTLTLEPRPRSTGELQGKMGVGAGIVLDSVAADEYAECQLKASFLTGADPGFELFETMYATREEGVRHLSRHLARLSASAATLGFKLDGETEIRAQIAGEMCGVASANARTVCASR